MNKLSIFALVLLVPINVQSSEICNALLENGVRDNFSTYTNEDTFDVYKRALCSEKFSTYDKYASALKNDNISIGYGDYSLGLTGNSDKKRKEFSSKYETYCDSTFDLSSVKKRFMRKSAVISSNLASAFNSCVSSHLSAYKASRGLRLYIDATVQDDFESFTIRLDRNTNSDTTVKNISPLNVSCKYGDNSIVSGSIISGSKVAISCKKSAKKAVTFSITTDGEGYSNDVTIPASKDRLYELEARLIELEEQLSINSPEKVIIAVKDNRCPAGWRDYAPAYGMFIRGIDKTGNTDTANRPHGNFQEQSIQSHSHPITVFPNKRAGKATYDRFNAANHEKRTTGKTTATGGKETRPKNVALLYCEKVD